MKRLVVALLAALSLSLPARAQSDVIRRPVRVGWVSDDVRLQLRVEYVGALMEGKERGYCITHLLVSSLDPAWPQDSGYTVLGVERGNEVDSTRTGMQVSFRCHSNVGFIHIHLPVRYDLTKHDEVVDPLNGVAECGPSPQDIDSGILSGSQIEAVMCSPESIVFYAPSDYAIPIRAHHVPRRHPKKRPAKRVH